MCISFGCVGACDIHVGNPGHSLGFFVRHCGCVVSFITARLKA